MKPIDFKGRCTKKKLSKSTDVARLFDKIQIAYADVLEQNDDIRSIRVNVPLDGEDCDRYTSDFLCERQNGDLMVRECVWRSQLSLPRTIKLLQLSQTYWRNHGVVDWGIVVESEVKNNEAE